MSAVLRRRVRFNCSRSISSSGSAHAASGARPRTHPERPRARAVHAVTPVAVSVALAGWDRAPPVRAREVAGAFCARSGLAVPACDARLRRRTVVVRRAGREANRGRRAARSGAHLTAYCAAVALRIAGADRRRGATAHARAVVRPCAVLDVGLAVAAASTARGSPVDVGDRVRTSVRGGRLLDQTAARDRSTGQCDKDRADRRNPSRKHGARALAAPHVPFEVAGFETREQASPWTDETAPAIERSSPGTP
jgi:hypothetical protein